MKKHGIFVAAVVAVAIGWVSWAGLAQGTVCLDGTFGVRAVCRMAETYVLGLVDAMRVVAASEDVRSGDWDQMVDLLLLFEESVLTYDAWFLLPDGSYYKAKTGLADANLSDRAYFARVMGGETTFDDLVFSRSTGRKSLVLTTPVFQGSAVIGAVGVTLYLDAFSLLLNLNLLVPNGVGFYAYRTSDGLISLHADPEVLLAPVASAGIAPVVGGIDISSALGWTFVLGTIR